MRYYIVPALEGQSESSRIFRMVKLVCLINMLPLFGYLSGIVTILGYPPYIRDIFQGTTRPERASWFIWSLLGSIAFASQFAEGARTSLWMTGAETAGTLTVFLISLRKGEGKLTERDVSVLIIASLGLVLWLLSRQAVYALFLVILTDAAGVLLTVIKSYEDPGSETLLAWVLASLGGLFAVLAVGKLSYILLAYPVYILLANLAIITAIKLGRRNGKA